MSELNLKRALKSLLSGKDDYCGLCLSKVEEKDCYQLGDEVLLNDEEGMKLQLIEILNAVLPDVSSNITSFICEQCTHTVVNTYNFINICKTNINNLCHILDNFNSLLNNEPENFTCKTVLINFDPKELNFKNYYHNQHINSCRSALRVLNKEQFKKKLPFNKRIKAKDPHSKSQFYSESIEYDVNIEKYIQLTDILCDRDDKAKFTCKICLMEHTDKRKLEQHFLMQHSDKLLDCRQCPKCFASMRSLKSHIYWIHEIINCKKCGQIIPNRYTMMYHNVKVHKNGNNLLCPMCETEFKYDTEYSKHYERCLEFKDELNIGAISKYGFRYKNYTQCKYCLMCKPSIKSLKKHYIAKHTRRTFKCEKCSESFDSQKTLSLHDRNADCHTTCNKVYNKLIAHETSQTRKIFGRKLCKTYKNTQVYKEHLNHSIYGREKKLEKYICDICGKEFRTKNSIRRHIKYVHLINFNVKFFPCMYCEKKFCFKSQLNCHMVKHTKVKNFVCEICGGKFVTKESLLYHTRIHTKETPYKCKLCDLSFLSSSRRADHVRIHHLPPSLPCKICSKKFKTSFGLKQHLLRHSNPNSSLYCAPNES